MDQDEDTQTVRRAKQQAYRLLAYRNRTSNELRDRLQQRGYTVAIIDEVLRQLASDGYLDDHKLALDWARYRLQAKPLGRQRLASELRRRGVPSESVKEVLREVYQEFDEVKLAERAARKRLGTGESPRSPRDRQRYIRHLLSLGFDTETVASALAAIFPSTAMRDSLSDDNPC